jgi:hypothetical protein
MSLTNARNLKNIRCAIKAREMIRIYREGGSLTPAQLNILHDCALEHCQLLDNVVHTPWFARALGEWIEQFESVFHDERNEVRP